MNRIGGPIVCGDQKLEIEQDSHAYIQGEGTTRITPYCVDEQTNVKQEVTSELNAVITRLQIVSGIIFGLVIFILAMLFLNWAAHRLNKSFAELFQPSVRRK